MTEIIAYFLHGAWVNRLVLDYLFSALSFLVNWLFL